MLATAEEPYVFAPGTNRPGVYHLVEDETMIVYCFKQRRSYRVRIWRQRNAPAIIVVQQLDKDDPCCLGAYKLVNAIYSDYLHRSVHGFHYYDVDFDGVWYVRFQSFGYAPRRIFAVPSRTSITADAIYQAIGQVIDL